MAWISRLSVTNSECFAAASVEALRRRVALVGPNNSGKSTFLRLLSWQNLGPVHRSRLSFPLAVSTPPQVEAFLDFTLDDGELCELAFKSVRDFRVAVPLAHANVPGAADWLRALTTPRIRVRRWRPPGAGDSQEFVFDQFGHGPVPSTQVDLKFDENGVLDSTTPGVTGALLEIQLYGILHQRIFSFLPERFAFGECDLNNGLRLEPSARNLAAVISRLQENRARAQQLDSLVARVLPGVRHVAARQNDSANKFVIRVWEHPQTDGRDDLAVPLASCGSGVAQVVAMLTALITAESALTFLIDEPTTFLHPGATRTLLRIMREPEFARHQIIVSTHSPEVLTDFEPDQVIVFKKANGASRVSVHLELVDQMRESLRALEVPLSRVFGPERLAWVEGPTEEAVFPDVLTKCRPLINLDRTAFVRCSATGDFVGRKRADSIRLYRHVANGLVLIPPAKVFILDREELTDEQVAVLAADKIRCLNRRAVENYLLHPAAIASVFSRLPSFSDAPLVVAVVEDWIRDHSAHAKYGPAVEYFSNMAVWATRGDAAALLTDCLSDLSAAREEYRKTRDSVAICREILRADAQFLEPLATELAALVDDG